MAQNDKRTSSILIVSPFNTTSKINKPALCEDDKLSAYYCGRYVCPTRPDQAYECPPCIRGHKDRNGGAIDGDAYQDFLRNPQTKHRETEDRRRYLGVDGERVWDEDFRRANPGERKDEEAEKVGEVEKKEWTGEGEEEYVFVELEDVNDVNENGGEAFDPAGLVEEVRDKESELNRLVDRTYGGLIRSMIFKVVYG